jgi:hypothetical protein
MLILADFSEHIKMEIRLYICVFMAYLTELYAT